MSEAASGKPRRLLFVPLERMETQFKKGNADYVRHYETYFDEIVQLFFYGFFAGKVRRGKVTWYSVGSRYRGLDLLLAPFRILRAAYSMRTNAFATTDLVFSWWTMSLVRLVLRGRVVLVPICYPEEIYAIGGRSLSGSLPIRLERFFIRLSFIAARKIVISRQNRTSIMWLNGDRAAKKKTCEVAVIPEQYPSPALLDRLSRNAMEDRELGAPARLLYVGRVHRQKLALELVDLISELQSRNVRARLIVAGDGPDLVRMKERARERKVEANIEWLGYVSHEDLGAVYGSADVFVSTVTGTALREAGFSRLPVVGYELKFFEGLLQHEANALLVPVHDVAGLATQVERVLADAGLRERIADRLHADIQSRWDPCLIRGSLAEAFSDCMS